MSESMEPTNRVKEEIVAHKRGNSFVLSGTAGTIGEITYQLVDVDTWLVDHTYVNPAHRGHGFARLLLDLVVEEARENGRKIVPSCTYALEQFQQNAEYADVWEKSTTKYSDPHRTTTLDSPGH
ncbi:Acetyltransferase (GNAT) family protein [compost metagenome]